MGVAHLSNILNNVNKGLETSIDVELIITLVTQVVFAGKVKVHVR